MCVGLSISAVDSEYQQIQMEVQGNKRELVEVRSLASTHPGRNYMSLLALSSCSLAAIFYLCS